MSLLLAASSGSTIAAGGLATTTAFGTPVVTPTLAPSSAVTTTAFGVPVVTSPGGASAPSLEALSRWLASLDRPTPAKLERLRRRRRRMRDEALLLAVDDG